MIEISVVFVEDYQSAHELSFQESKYDLKSDPLVYSEEFENGVQKCSRLYGGPVI